MLLPRDSRRRTSIWIGTAILAVLVAGLVVRGVITRNEPRLVPMAAYLVPLDGATRVKFEWWHSTTITVPTALPSGKTVAVPKNARLRIVHAGTGESELVTGPTQLQLQQPAPTEPAALISPLRELIPAMQKLLDQRGAAFSITSPVGVTRYLNPLITWTAQDGVLYDIAVADPADPLVPIRIARGMKPPVPLAELQTPQRRQLIADRNYEVAVRIAGAPALAGAARVLTSPDADATTPIPSSPADLIAEAIAAIAKKPTRTGDAWLALSRLPSDWAASEPALRLRLQVAAELGLAEEFERAHEEAKRLLRHQ